MAHPPYLTEEAWYFARFNLTSCYIILLGSPKHGGDR